MDAGAGAKSFFSNNVSKSKVGSNGRVDIDEHVSFIRK